MAFPERSNPCPELDTRTQHPKPEKEPRKLTGKSGGALTGRFYVSGAAVPNG
jgi:hypothetical protein